MNDELYQSGELGSSVRETRHGPSAGEAKEKMVGKAKEASASIHEMAREAKAEAKERGTEAMHDLQDQGKQFARTRKDELAHRIRGGGEAIRRAAEKLREEDDPNIARYAELVADRVQQAGEYVQSRNLEGLIRDVESVARRRPEILFGGMFVAGLAISRFLKASSERGGQRAEPRGAWVEQGYQTDFRAKEETARVEFGKGELWK